MVGDRIKELRKKLGWTQKKLSEMMNITVPSLSRYELNNSIPSTDMISRLEPTGVNIHWLVTGHGDMFRGDSKEIDTLSREINDIGTEISDRIPEHRCSDKNAVTGDTEPNTIDLEMERYTRSLDKKIDRLTNLLFKTYTNSVSDPFNESFTEKETSVLKELAKKLSNAH